MNVTRCLGIFLQSSNALNVGGIRTLVSTSMWNVNPGKYSRG